MNIRSIARVLLLCAAVVTGAPAQSQQYPSKPIRLLVGYPPGGGTDALARLYATKLQDVLKVPVVVDNRPGASEIIAANTLMSAPADGHTLWLAGAGLTMAPTTRKDVRFEPLKSFTLVGRAAAAQGVFAVRNHLPVNSLPELVSYAKAHPGKLSYGSAGVGLPGHLMFELFKISTETDIVHVPFKGDADLAREIVAENLDVALVALSVMAPFITEGRLKPIGVTGSERVRGLPNVPSLGEGAVKGMEKIDVFVSWGLVAPAGTPQSVVDKLNEAVNKVGRMPDVVQQLDQLYMKPLPSSPSEFRQHVSTELARWQAVSARLKLVN